jgi:XTP/dITP diphosphohydrolase
MNPPLHPSQEGNLEEAPETKLPSWEGVGVGSGGQDAIRVRGILISSRNAHKCDEIKALLPSTIRWFTLKDFPSAPEVVEDANSFAGNATKKSVQFAQWLGASSAGSPQLLKGTTANDWFVLADDSGLEVDALNGAPGVHSARFAALEKSLNSPDAANNAKLLDLLHDVPWEKRTARFRCVIALSPVLAAPAGNQSPVCFSNEIELQTELFDGSCEGKIGFSLSGKGGFGYDPLFFPSGFDRTFAELGDEVKNQISHRAKALLKLRQRLSV